MVSDEKKMKLSDFVTNLDGVDGGGNFDPKLLKSIYKSIKKRQFEGGEDHVAQTQLIQQSIAHHSKQMPQLAEPHRRLVCLCRLYEVIDINATKKPVDLHQRDIFLFNDLVVVTKQTSAAASATDKHHHRRQQSTNAYSYRDSFHLKGLEVTLFHTPVFDFGIQISRKSTDCVLLTLNAGSEHDRYKFVMDLQESIFEVNQMEKAVAQISAS